VHFSICLACLFLVDSRPTKAGGGSCAQHGVHRVPTSSSYVFGGKRRRRRKRGGSGIRNAHMWERVSSTDTSMKDSQGPGLGKKEDAIVENKKKKILLTVLDVQEKRKESLLLVRDSFSFRKDTSQIQSPSVHPHAKVQINLTQGLLSSQKIIDGLRPGLLLPYWTLSYPLYILCIGQNVKRSSSNTARENDSGRRGRPFRFLFSSSGRKENTTRLGRGGCVRFVSFYSGLLLFLALNVCHISRRPVVSCG
jgi:hypothetical protein